LLLGQSTADRAFAIAATNSSSRAKTDSGSIERHQRGGARLARLAAAR
jgi:hypothetical protein